MPADGALDAGARDAAATEGAVVGRGRRARRRATVTGGRTAGVGTEVASCRADYLLATDRAGASTCLRDP